MVIHGYVINGYSCLYYEWLFMIILLMSIRGYFNYYYS
jgi:hypothetical protein